MKKIMLCLSLVLCLWLSAASAEIPRLINYQGKLTTSAGAAVPDGTHQVTFYLFDAENAGNMLWEEAQSVTVQKGIFNVILGGVTALDIPFDKPYWLQIKVGSEVLAPRQRLASAAYAIKATGIAGTLTTKEGGTGTNANANTSNGIVKLDANAKLPAVDGSGLTGLIGGVFKNARVFTSSGTWNWSNAGSPSKVYVKCWGSGGKGGTSWGYGGGGGGGGGYAEGPIAVTGDVTVTVGTGSGTTNTTFAGSTTITANYGVVGGDGSDEANGTGGAGGSASGGIVNLTGETGKNGNGGKDAFALGGAGGAGMFGGGGGAPIPLFAGYAGSPYGGGGSGGSNGLTDQTGGNGASGLVIVFW